MSTDPPTEEDFAPQGRRPGYRMRPGTSPQLQRAIMDGVSVFDAEAAARAQHQRFQQTGSGSGFRFIAVLDIPADSGIVCDDQFGNEHHWDLYSSPGELLSCVTRSDIPL